MNEYLGSVLMNLTGELIFTKLINEYECSNIKGLLDNNTIIFFFVCLSLKSFFSTDGLLFVQCPIKIQNSIFFYCLKIVCIEKKIPY